MVTQERLKELFDYDDGHLYWKIHRWPKRIGTEVGFTNSGYLKTHVGNKIYPVHRLIWQWHNGLIPPGLVIDHVNMDKRDNHIENLRPCSIRENVYVFTRATMKSRPALEEEDLMGNFVDFAAVKARVSIVEAADRLGLKMTVSQKQLRGPCPRCAKGGERALVITPSKSVFYCFASGGEDQGKGDQIALVAHIQDCSTRDAALWLGGTVKEPVTSEQVTVTSNRKDHATSGFPALDYLEPDHEAVSAVGFDPIVAKALGIGYAVKGMMRGTVAIPLRLEDGSIAGYIGVTEAKLPTKWHGIDTNILPFKKGAA